MRLFVGMFSLLYATLSVRTRAFLRASTMKRASLHVAAVSSLAECDLPPNLEKVCTALSSVGDDKVRYQQLLYLAAKAKPMPSGNAKKKIHLFFKHSTR
jgi:hypothetical protein